MHGEKLKPKIDNEWEEYTKANPTAGHSPGGWFTFRNEKMREWYEELSDEGKKEVEEYRQKHKDGSIDEDNKSGDNKNHLLQR
jgi:hypothetical protein